MNAIEFLKQDHEKVKALFKQFEEAGERAHKKKQTIAEKTIMELKKHTQLEEKVFYPAVMAKGGKEARDLVLEGIEEHRVADFMIERLQQVQPEDDTFSARYKVLMESVEHHIEEEEKQMFPEAKKILGDELTGIGVQLEQMEKQLKG